MWAILAQTTTGADFRMEDLPGLLLAVFLMALIIFGAQGGFRRRRPVERQPRSDRPADVVADKQPRAVTPPSAPAAPVREVLPVRRWVPLLFDLSAHILILAGSGSGKTRTARGLVRYIVEQRRERLIIFDPKANRDTWMGLPALVDPVQIARTMRGLLDEFERRRRLNPTMTEVEADQAFERVWIVVDEVSFIRDTLGDGWILFLKRISSMARSLKLHLIVINQSDRVDELGLKGRGDLIANFTLLRLTQAGWQGAPARMEVGEREYLGEWLSYFPESYRGPTLPTSAIYALPETAPEEGGQDWLTGNERDNSLPPARNDVTDAESTISARTSQVTTLPETPETPLTPAETALITRLLVTGVTPSDTAKRLPGYSPKRYQAFKAKVDMVRALLATDDSAEDLDKPGGEVPPPFHNVQ